MDLRTLSPGLSSIDRVNERRTLIERETGADLSSTEITSRALGHAEERNCEQMFGAVPLPVGLAGPVSFTFSSLQKAQVYLPLATTEGALVASVNRGCKALNQCKVLTTSTHLGTNRSIAFRTSDPEHFTKELVEQQEEWRAVAESTSHHLKILGHDLDSAEDHVFLTIICDTGDAMGMNMVTLAAQAIGEWVVSNFPDVRFVTVAGNVDSDKKPSFRTVEHGRGFEVGATAILDQQTIRSILKTHALAMSDVAHAKLDLGSTLAGSLGHNLQAANIVAALYLATGQDAAHVVEGSLGWTRVALEPAGGLRVTVRLPAVMVGVRGGGTTLPAQAQCLDLLLKKRVSLSPRQQLAETVGCAVLAGEISLLAAQASHDLAGSHKRLGR